MSSGSSGPPSLRNAVLLRSVTDIVELLKSRHHTETIFICPGTLKGMFLETKLHRGYTRLRLPRGPRMNCEGDKGKKKERRSGLKRIFSEGGDCKNKDI